MHVLFSRHLNRDTQIQLPADRCCQRLPPSAQPLHGPMVRMVFPALSHLSGIRIALIQGTRFKTLFSPPPPAPNGTQRQSTDASEKTRRSAARGLRTKTWWEWALIIYLRA